MRPVRRARTGRKKQLETKELLRAELKKAKFFVRDPSPLILQ
jgi:hypothetical protein